MSQGPPAHIFRQYDVRGIAGEELTPAVVRRIGGAYATLLAETRSEPGTTGLRVVVGRDNRPSSPALADALAEGVAAAGLEVVEIGTAPTPVAYWAERVLGTDGALQVTGSHNPPEYNGIKMTVGGDALWGETIQEIASRVRTGRIAKGAGARSSEAVLDRYIADLQARFRLARPVRLAVDCGNGVGSLAAVPLLRGIGAEVTPLFCDSDGTFPNHHPDPTVDENLEDLIAAVERVGADAGIGFDGDADRIGVVDEHGRVVRGDLLLLLFAEDFIARKDGSPTVVFDVKCSEVLPRGIRRAGGVPLMWKTGHSLIKRKMKEVGAPLAGELSGHLCFGADYYGFDDALFAACRLAELLSRLDRTLGEWMDGLPAMVSTPEIRIETDEARKFDLVEAARAYFSRRHEVVTVDGARILFDGGWALLRASNTQPAIVARFEAETQEGLSRIRATVEAWLREQGVDV